MERKIFRGLGALAVRITSDTTCEIMPLLSGAQPRDYRRAPLPLDLTRTPTQAPRWVDVTIDDRGVFADGSEIPAELDPFRLSRFGVTTLGPSWPMSPAVGAVYLEESFFLASYATYIDVPGFKWPGNGFASYELTTIADTDQPDAAPRAVRRYAGVHARVDSVRGTLADVTIFQPGQSAAATPRALASTAIDFADPAVVAPGIPRAGEALAQPTPGSVGGLYLALTFLAQPTLAYTGPKLPIGMGA